MSGTVTKLGDNCYRADIDISVTDTLDLHPFTYGTDAVRAVGAAFHGIKPWNKTQFGAEWQGTYFKSRSHPYTSIMEATR